MNKPLITLIPLKTVKPGLRLRGQNLYYYLVDQYGYLTIGKKIAFMVALFALLMVLQLGIAHWGYQVVVTEVQKIQESQAVQAATAGVHQHVLAARIQEKNFFVQPQALGKVAFLEELDQASQLAGNITLSGFNSRIQAHLDAIKAQELTKFEHSVFDEEPAAATTTAKTVELPTLTPEEQGVLGFYLQRKALVEMLTDYRLGFEQSFSMHQVMGFDDASGYKGKAKLGLDQVEAGLKHFGQTNELPALAQIRKRYGDYLDGVSAAHGDSQSMMQAMRDRLTARLGKGHELTKAAGTIDSFMSNADRVAFYRAKAEGVSQGFQQNFAHLPQVLHELDALALERQIVVGKKAHEAMQLIQDRLWGVGLTGILFLVALGVILSRSIIEPINRVFELTAQLSAGDLKVRLDDGRRDELGQMSKAFNQFAHKLQSTIQTIHHNSQNLSAMSTELSATTCEIEATTQGVNKGVEHSNQSLQTAAQDIESLAAATSRINQETAQLRQRSADMAAETHQGSQTMQSAQEAFARIAESSTKIKGIIGMINNLSVSTNLLSFNAAIEAARAGHEGKGFQVIAQSVRNLANETQDSAREIAHLVKASHREVTTSSQVIEEAANRFCSLTQEATQISQSLDAMSHDINHQEAKTRNLAYSTQSIHQVSQQNGIAMGSLAAAIKEVDFTVAELTHMAEDLHGQVLQFRA